MNVTSPCLTDAETDKRLVQGHLRLSFPDHKTRHSQQRTLRGVTEPGPCEVKEMAEKAAAGKLGILSHYRQEEPESGSDLENIDELFHIVNIEDRQDCRWDEIDNFLKPDGLSEQNDFSSSEDVSDIETGGDGSSEVESAVERTTSRGGDDVTEPQVMRWHLIITGIGFTTLRCQQSLAKSWLQRRKA
ncbi:hypothetical protein NDU88_002574 [Pleurodeles waltl]|uniref:Uncharacterized protein n=1 Tax=Pleurodeles waltl TaxID=8319 RepID=A0AAV7UA31_PLEWA|nr:hypothetical protein NDU88_002574 [Pleurodeles waltl]